MNSSPRPVIAARLYPSEDEDVARLETHLGMSRSEIVREGIAALLEKHGLLEAQA